jgi:predicted nucleic acid-binding protein
MPPRAGRKVIFDTNIYIDAVRGGPGSKEYGALFNSLPFLYLSSVVSAELYAGALDPFGTRLIQRFVSRSEKVGRIVTPTHVSWNEAGRILAKIGVEEPKYRSRLPILFNDILIALCALQIGARVCTKDREDFQLIRRYKRLGLEII